MGLQIVPFEEKLHYASLVSYWKQYGWNIPPADLLPSTGIVVEKEGVAIAACFIYLTNSKGALMEWLIADKQIDPSIRRKVIPYLLEGVLDIARKKGYKYVNTFTANLDVIDKLKVFIISSP